MFPTIKSFLSNWYAKESPVIYQAPKTFGSLILISFILLLVAVFGVWWGVDWIYSKSMTLKDQTISGYEQRDQLQGTIDVSDPNTSVQIEHQRSPELQDPISSDLASPVELLGSLIENVSFKITDLVVGDRPIIEGKTFTNCVIWGPAVIVPKGKTVITGSVFRGFADAVFWKLDSEQKRISGAIEVKDSVFRNCEFVNVAVLLPRNRVDEAIRLHPLLTPDK